MHKQLKKNFIFAFVAQAISLIVSCSTNLVLPKELTVTGYSYWQLFIFYCTYVPFLALGLNDGIYLRYGGYYRKDLDKSAVKSQLIVGVLYQGLLCFIISIIFSIISSNFQRTIIIWLVFVYYLIYTSHNFLGFIFQAVNQTNIYSKSIIIVRIVFLTAQILLMAMGVKNVNFYILFYIFAISIALLYLIVKFHPELQTGKFSFALGVRESWLSIRVGISLMLANICSLLILGVSRQIIDMHWGLITFGKVSFALTLMNFALTFIMQIGLVLFPALRRLSTDKLKSYYARFNRGLFYLLPVMYLAYLPVGYLLKLWLPKYAISIDYLATALPICYFDSKMNLIGNTFFKVLNKQVLLFKINVVMVLLSSIMCCLAAFVFNSINLVIIGMVAAIMFRSVLSDLLLSHDIGINVIGYEIMDVLLAVVFILGANLLVWWQAMIAIVIIYLSRVMTIKITIQNK